MTPDWINIDTTQPIEYTSKDVYGVPVAVMQTAVTPSGSGTVIEFDMDVAESGFRYNQFYANLYFSEFDALLPNQSRAVDIFLNGEIWQADYAPPYLLAGFVCSVAPIKQNSTYHWEIKPNDSSNLPPILNALEMFSAMYLDNVTTNERDGMLSATYFRFSDGKFVVVIDRVLPTRHSTNCFPDNFIFFIHLFLEGKIVPLCLLFVLSVEKWRLIFRHHITRVGTNYFNFCEI